MHLSASHWGRSGVLGFGPLTAHGDTGCHESPSRNPNGADRVGVRAGRVLRARPPGQARIVPG